MFAPTLLGEVALQVLPSRNQHALDVHIVHPAESEATQPMPLLGLGEERFHPDPPFAHGLLEGWCSGRTFDPLHGRRMERAMHLSPLVARRAGGFQGAGVAGRGVGLILGLLRFRLDPRRSERLGLAGQR